MLLRYYPAALKTFKTGLSAQITLERVLAYPTPQDAQQLTYPQFVEFARQHRYPDYQRLPDCFTRLQANDPPACAETVQIYQPQTVCLARLLLESLRTRLQTLAELQRQYRQHPNHAIFASLPGTGEIIGPGLLVKFGDERERFPTARSVQSLAGTCPVTDKSGKRRTVRFRRSCDKEWRALSQEWAMALVQKTQAPLAVAYYQQVRPHCRSDAHAYRCVANRWLAIAWKLWKTGTTYDPAYHFQQHAARQKPRQ